ncbi:MAG: undecaprenyl-diphosphate phosphatase [candidate division WS1 bacterium]|jgi:undecaprenyl-diphosphatase|nr:undecaprenyl-diphosphate phosphatase [candidate division WS1 bacterium]
MGAVEAIVLAVVQGLTEFLPVSSSGHLALGHWLLGLGAEETELPLAFVVFVHFGTLMAVVVYYWSDLAEIVRDVFRPNRAEGEGETCGWGRRLLILLVVATLPAILAVLVEDQIETLLNLPWAVGVALLITGTALIVSERLGRRVKADRETKPLDALLVGFAQMAAVVPGISRSGSTIAAGLGVGFKRDWAARFAFLMSVPAILGGTIFKLKDLIEAGGDGALGLYLLCGLISAVTGYVAIRLVIGAVQTSNLKWFAIYCYVVGVAAIIADVAGLL